VRAIIGVPATLLVPGYVICQAFWPRMYPGFAERLALSVGLSFVTCIITGLLIYLAGAPLNTTSWPVALGGLTLVCAALAAMRRRGLDAATSESVSRAGLPSWSVLALGGAAVGLAVGAVGIATLSAGRQQESFSELWLVQPDARGRADSLDVGLRSVEQQATQFSVQILDGDQVIMDVGSINLAPGETWETTVPFDESASDGQPIQARAFRADNPTTPYRQVELRPAQKG